MSTAGAKRPEVLSPAGSPDALRAAIGAGADAVYFGLDDWNARIRATNFTLGDLPDVVKDLRRWGVRSCLTFNTLIFLEEERAAKDALHAIAQAGPDAIIVQDLGVLRWVREIAPNVEVHASTQMTVTSEAGVDLLGRLGATRVVLARELSLAEISRIKAATTVELEVFVHGALCVSYSGQCLSSEAWGGRSANRGQCAQACRHPYDLVVDGLVRDMGDRAYLLSPRDLEGFRRIAELTSIGIAAFKIEGRMKSAEYVAAATRLYRAEVDRVWARLSAGRDAAGVPPKVERLAVQARQVFSRGESEGFLGGVNHQILVDGRARSHRGVEVGTVISLVRDLRGPAARVRVFPAMEIQAGDGLLFDLGARPEDELGGSVFHADTGEPGERTLVFSRELNLARVKPETRVFRTAHQPLLHDLQQIADHPEQHRQVAIALHLTGGEGEELRLTVTDPEGQSVVVFSGARLVAATAHGLTEDRLREQLGRWGGTRYRLERLEWNEAVLSRLFLPVSVLNRLRRAAYEALEDLRGRRAPIADRVVAGVDATPELESCDTAIAWAIERAGPVEPAEVARTAGSPPAGGAFEDRVMVLCRDRIQVRAAIDGNVRRIALDFLDLVGLKAALAELRAAGCSATLALPRVQKPGEEGIERYFLNLEPAEILVRSLGSLERLRTLRAAVPLVGDASLNGVNPIAIDLLLSLGLARVTPGFDLNGAQLESLLGQVDPARLEIPIHHHLPVFHTEHCVFAAFLSSGADYRTCGRPCDRHRIGLEDRTGERHPVVADVGCRNTVWSARPQSGLPHLTAYRRAGVGSYRIELIGQDAGEVRHIVEIHRRAWNGDEDWKSALGELRAVAAYGIGTGSPEPSRKLDLKPVGGRRRPRNRRMGR